MKRIAILGGGISGLACAYELEKARQSGADLDWHLYEASSRLGGIVETSTHETEDGPYVLEGGPDAWVSDKPWARDLALELGLEADLIHSNDSTRKTYILIDGALQAIPDGMRMMVPTDLAALEHSPLFTTEARRAYSAEIDRAAELRAAAPGADESVASFVLRHFGTEVLTTLAAPLLSGVFGGDVYKLSVQSVMMPFVQMEREHGSLILALQARAKERGDKPAQPIFTSLRRGMGSLVDAILATLPEASLHPSRPALSLKPQGRKWLLRTGAFSTADPARTSKKHVDHVVLATSLDAARHLLPPLAADAAAQLPTDASSAVLAALTWPADLAARFTVPPGFGFLVPPNDLGPRPSALGPALLACTFVDQKFPHRAPTGARILRAFFGGPSADHLRNAPDDQVAAAALDQLRSILGPIPEPAHVEVRRWPRSLPQYEVGHLDRMAQLDSLLARLPGLHLLGNSLRGVGLPDLIRDARTTARAILG